MHATILRTLAIVLTVCAWSSFSQATTYTISEGLPIQPVIDKAEPGDTIQVLPGDYNETILINKPGLIVLGMEYEGVRATLDGLNKDSQERASVAISIEADDVVCRGFRLRNVSSPAVKATGRRNIEITGLDIDVIGDFGIHLEDIVGLKLSGTTVRGASDTGILLNRCQDADLSKNEVYRNAIGLALLDGVQIQVNDLTAHTNGMGMIVANTDGGDAKAEYTTITNSRFVNIGTVHTPESATTSAFYMAGLGIRIVGASHTEVARCVFEGNGSVGVLTQQWAGDNDERPVGPRFTYVHHNVYLNNGAQPSDTFSKSFPEFDGGDLYWDGEGRRNQWQEADPASGGTLKVYPENLISKFGGVHTNVMHFQ